MKKTIFISFLLLISFVKLSAQQITEIDYDVPGTDAAGTEKLEVFFPTGVNPDDFSIIRINGATATSGVVYTTSAFAGRVCSSVTGGQVCVYTGSADCLQNGANDAVILYNTVTAMVAHAIAYEGAVTVSSSASPTAIQGLVIASVGTDAGANANESLNDDDLNGVFTLTTSNFGALPIELLSLTVAGLSNLTLLSFATASERNNERFEIERSADGRTFQVIGVVKGAGDAQTQNNYTFTDEHPLRGINYYRLRQVDFDGASTLSQVVSVTFGKTGNVVLYPTPANETMNVRFDEAFTTDANWQIVDLTGRILNEGIFAAEQTEFRIPVASLTQGAYILRVTANNEVVTQQFRKQ